MIRPQFIVVTSNYKISELDFADNIDDEAFRAVQRRFHEIELVETDNGANDAMLEFEHHFSTSQAVIRYKTDALQRQQANEHGETLGEDGEMGIDLDDEEERSVDEEENPIELSSNSEEEDEESEIEEVFSSQWQPSGRGDDYEHDEWASQRMDCITPIPFRITRRPPAIVATRSRPQRIDSSDDE